MTAPAVVVVERAGDIDVIEVVTGGGGGTGAPGPPGVGVPAGGAVGTILGKTGATDYATGWVPAPEGGGGDLTANEVAAQLQLVVLNAADAAPAPGVWLRRP